MNGIVFVDADVLIYAHDRQAGTKYVRAQELLEKLWHEKRGVVSTPVLQEFCVNARRNPFSPLAGRS